MSIFGLLFLIFILYIFVVPLLRIVMAVNRAKRRAREVFGGAYSTQEPPSRKPGWSEPVRHKKKIDKSVGEYVHYEEVESTVSYTRQGDATYVETEQQIVDAEWEDLP